MECTASLGTGLGRPHQRKPAARRRRGLPRAALQQLGNSAAASSETATTRSSDGSTGCRPREGMLSAVSVHPAAIAKATDTGCDPE